MIVRQAGNKFKMHQTQELLDIKKKTRIGDDQMRLVDVVLTSSFIAEPPDPIREPVMPFGSRNLIATLLVTTSLDPKLAISTLLIVCDGVGSYYS